jgi:hypothetical protein
MLFVFGVGPALLLLSLIFGFADIAQRPDFMPMVGGVMNSDFVVAVIGGLENVAHQVVAYVSPFTHGYSTWEEPYYAPFSWDEAYLNAEWALSMMLTAQFIKSAYMKNKAGMMIGLLWLFKRIFTRIFGLMIYYDGATRNGQLPFSNPGSYMEDFVFDKFYLFWAKVVEIDFLGLSAALPYALLGPILLMGFIPLIETEFWNVIEEELNHDWAMVLFTQVQRLPRSLKKNHVMRFCSYYVQALPYIGISLMAVYAFFQPLVLLSLTALPVFNWLANIDWKSFKPTFKVDEDTKWIRALFAVYGSTALKLLFTPDNCLHHTFSPWGYSGTVDGFYARLFVYMLAGLYMGHTTKRLVTINHYSAICEEMMA